MAECSPLDAFVQLAKAHGLVEETHNITATLVASQAEELLHATQQHADARLHDALAQAQSVYEPLLSEDAVQSQAALLRAVLDGLQTVLTEGKDRVLSQLQRPPPIPSIPVPFSQQPSLVQLLHAAAQQALDVNVLHSNTVVFEKPTWGGLMQPWIETCTNIHQHAAVVVQQAETAQTAMH